MIELADVSRVYKLGDVTVSALSHINLRVEQGELVSIVGHSGSGKSTLLYLLGCLDTPTSGSYILNGMNVAAVNDKTRSTMRNQTLGFVFQSFNLLPRLTAVENVEIPLVYARVPEKARRERAKEALAQVGLAERLKHRPTELSGGQQQRVAIARALINQPSIVLADEPTGNLDSRSGWEIIELLEGVNAQGITVILVTHNPEIAARTPRTIRLADGQIVEG